MGQPLMGQPTIGQLATNSPNVLSDATSSQNTIGAVAQKRAKKLARGGTASFQQASLQSTL